MTKKEIEDGRVYIGLSRILRSPRGISRKTFTLLFLAKCLAIQKQWEAGK